MKVQLGIVMIVLGATVGAWVLMKPPGTSVERLATGEIVRSENVVTRAEPTTAMLLAPEMAGYNTHLLDQTLSNILDGLGFPAVEPAPSMMHQAALRPVDDAVINTLDASPLARIIIDAIALRTDDASIDALVNTGAANGDFAVPAALITTDGTVDTATLLAGVVSGAKMRIGQSLPSIQTPSAIYTVASGDSLASIAADLYGEMSAYSTLLAANSVLLSSPADISVGMRLLVPPT